MAKLIIKRDNDFINGFRDYKIKLDDSIFPLENDEHKILNVTQGLHSLRASIDGCGSKTFNFEITNEEDTFTLLIKNNYVASFILIFSIAAVLSLAFASSLMITKPWIVIASMALMLGLVYFTVLKDRYLKIERV